MNGTAELKRPRTSHVELPLDELDTKFVASLQRHEGLRKIVGGLTFALIGDG